LALANQFGIAVSDEEVIPGSISSGNNHNLYDLVLGDSDITSVMENLLLFSASCAPVNN
jgi:hypothetical protein